MKTHTAPSSDPGKGWFIKNKNKKKKFSNIVYREVT